MTTFGARMQYAIPGQNWVLASNSIKRNTQQELLKPQQNSKSL